jgi:hypothetical protein
VTVVPGSRIVAERFEGQGRGEEACVEVVDVMRGVTTVIEAGLRTPVTSAPLR